MKRNILVGLFLALILIGAGVNTFTQRTSSTDVSRASSDDPEVLCPPFCGRP